MKRKLNRDKNHRGAEIRRKAKDFYFLYIKESSSPRELGAQNTLARRAYRFQSETGLHDNAVKSSLPCNAVADGIEVKMNDTLHREDSGTLASTEPSAIRTIETRRTTLLLKMKDHFLFLPPRQRDNAVEKP